MTLNRWDPFKDLLDFQQKVNRAMCSVADQSTCERSVCWQPAVDILETRDEFHFRMDLPGVGMDNINIEVFGDRVTIRGERPLEDKPVISVYHSIERENGVFQRSFLLPHKVDSERCEARYADGVLSILLPKVAEPQDRKVPVRSED